MPFEDLPTDILLDIVPYLEANEFLALCATSKALSTLQLDPTYWRYLTRSTYRLPPQPLLQADGARWRSLYQRILTESRAYTWGLHGRLGHSWDLRGEIPRLQHSQWANRGFPVGSGFSGIGWPTEMDGVRQMKPVVDLQCGGYSTTVLDSVGDLYCTGTIDGFANARNAFKQLTCLKYPTPYPQGEQRTPATTIAQFSSGRDHILGLTDSGRIWVWTNIPLPACHVKFLQVDVLEDQTPPIPEDAAVHMGRVKRVVAGWDCSTAYVAKKGIVVWKEVSPLDKMSRAAGHVSEADGILVGVDVIPDTSYQRPKGSQRERSAEAETLGHAVGEVVNHIALEGYIVFLTDLGKVFAAPSQQLEQMRPGIVELKGFEPSEGKGRMKEIQGKFRTFAVFNTDGDVVLADIDLVKESWKAFEEHREVDVTQHFPKRPTALQNRGITSLAFGDWHTLALTAEGHILSFGKAPQSCGCLGLGRWDEGSVLRGVKTLSHWPQDSELVGEIEGQGRRIWFSPEQREWLKHMLRSGLSQEELARISGPQPDQARHEKISHWFEKHGADWDLHEELDDGSQPWGHGESSYVAVSISAAGWQSGALVLTNEQRVQRSHALHRGFLGSRNSATVATASGSTQESNVYTKGVKRWFNSWWPENVLPRACNTSPEDDQKAGRDHACYYDERDTVLSEAAEHPVDFDAARDLDLD